MKRLSLLAVFLSLAVSVRADSFTTLDGDSYTNCTVKRVEPDGIVITVLLCCSLSIAGAIFLIDEMAGPLDGTIKISSAPLHLALDQLGK